MKIQDTLFCHACDKNISFTLNGSLNGNHIIRCPNCGHEHCRVIKDGKVTGDRWDQRNGNLQTYYSTNTYLTSSTAGTFIYYDSNSTGTTTW